MPSGQMVSVENEFVLNVSILLGEITAPLRSAPLKSLSAMEAVPIKAFCKFVPINSELLILAGNFESIWNFAPDMLASLKPALSICALLRSTSTMSAPSISMKNSGSSLGSSFADWSPKRSFRKVSSFKKVSRYWFTSSWERLAPLGRDTLGPRINPPSSQLSFEFELGQWARQPGRSRNVSSHLILFEIIPVRFACLKSTTPSAFSKASCRKSASVKSAPFLKLFLADQAQPSSHESNSIAKAG